MAVKGGEATKNAALVLIQQLEREQARMEELKEGLAQASANSQKIMQMRAAFEQKVRKQIEECRAQLSRAEMAQAEERMASLMGTFKVGDVTDTLETVTGQIDERLAKARAKMQVAGESTDAQIAQVELQTSAASAEDKYAALAAKYGVATSAVEVARTMTGIPVDEQPAQETVVSIPMANGNAYEPKNSTPPVNVTIKTNGQ